MATQVLSPIMSREQPTIRPVSTLPLQVNTTFSPIDENGTFVIDKIFKEGWVWQRTRKTKQWKRRWYILRGSVIGIYKDNKERKLHSQIPLEELTACSMLKGDKRPNVFGLFSPSRNYHIQAETHNDAEEWLALIRQNARIEETEEEFLMSPTLETHPIPIPLSDFQPHSPTSRGMDGFMSSNTLEYSGTSMSSTSELGGMVSRTSLASPAGESSTTFGKRPESANMTGSVQPQSLPQESEPEPGVGRKESGLSSYEEHISDSRVIYQGYLWVLKSKSGLRQWKKLWIVLRPRNITFYKSDEEYRALKLIPMDTIINAVDIDPISKSKKHCMQLILDDKSYKFAASSEENLMKWLGAFKSTLVKSRK